MTAKSHLARQLYAAEREVERLRLEAGHKQAELMGLHHAAQGHDRTRERMVLAQNHLLLARRSLFTLRWRRMLREMESARMCMEVAP